MSLVASPRHRFISMARGFGADKRGMAAAWFALMAVPVFGMAGAALEFGHAYTKQLELQSTLDNAVLAGIDSYRATGSAGQAEDTIRRFVTETMAENGVSASTTPVAVTVNGINTQTGSISASASLTVKASFLGLLGLPDTEVSATSAASMSGNTLELALVLDVTGSMNDTPSGDTRTKLEAMKVAAKDFLSIIMTPTMSADAVRVSLTTFSAKVKVDANTAAAVTGSPKSRTVQSTQTSASATQYEWVTHNVCRSRYTMLYQQQGQGAWRAENNADDRCDKDSGIETQRVDGTRYYWSPKLVQTTVDTTQFINPCMIERSGNGTTRYQDAVPSSGSGWTAGYSTTRSEAVTCPSASPLIPLTSDRAHLEQVINELTGDGGTAGHIGTAWGWYTISPYWYSIWPDGSKPVAYGTRNHFKVVVIMTDGEYNTAYNNIDSTAQARQLCSQMKQTIIGESARSQQKVQVYTIGFGIGGNATARQLLIDCASSANHYFFPYNGEDLREAFRNIGTALMAGGLGSRLIN